MPSLLISEERLPFGFSFQMTDDSEKKNIQMVSTRWQGSIVEVEMLLSFTIIQFPLFRGNSANSD